MGTFNIPAIPDQSNAVTMTVPTITSPKDLITKDDELILMQVGLNLSEGQWLIGDIVNKIISSYDLIIANNLAIVSFGTMQLYSHIASLCGKGVSSIRRYAAVAKFYSVQDRENYCLSFSHFANAMAYPTRWKEILAACVEQMTRSGGKTPPADWVKVYANTNYITDMEAERMVDESRNMPLYPDDGDVAGWQSTSTDSVTPAYVPSNISTRAAARFMPYLVEVRDNIARFINAIPVSDNLKHRCAVLLSEFDKIMEEIRLEMQTQTNAVVDRQRQNMLQ